MEQTKKNNTKQEVDAAIKKLNNEISRLKVSEKEEESGKNISDKVTKGTKCRYFNSGYCKYKNNCKFAHPSDICKATKSKKDVCQKRHPKLCKWCSGASGCSRGNSCEYSHDTLVCDDALKSKFQCVSCKHEWEERKFVVQHKINHMEVYFCLNCDDWVKQKEKVFDDGWSLFDHDGNLEYGV